jgi:hypothetical protein
MKLISFFRFSGVLIVPVFILVFTPVIFLSLSILIVATLCMSYTFIGVGRTQEYPEKTIDLPQLIDKLYHIFPGRYPLYP